MSNKNDNVKALVEKIRSEYEDKGYDELDKLRRLDKSVKKPAKIFAYIFGGVGAIVMGSGMSLIMTDIGSTLNISNSMTVGIAVGVVGMLMAIVNYPIYKKLLGSRKEKYAGEVLALSKALGEKIK